MQRCGTRFLAFFACQLHSCSSQMDAALLVLPVRPTASPVQATETPDFFPSACSGSWCRATPTPWDSLAAAAVVPILSLPIPVQALLRDQPNLVTHPFALDSLADSRVSATLRTAKKLLVKVHGPRSVRRQQND